MEATAQGSNGSGGGVRIPIDRDSIDRDLAAWSSRLAAIAGNLLELKADPTYRMLTGTGSGTRISITGQTAAYVEPALRSMHVIFDNFELLHSTVEQAKRIREDLPALFGAEPKLREIAMLLHSRSIELPSVEVPLGDRSLLTRGRTARWISPDELLQGMVRDYTAAKDAVLAVGNAWEELARRIDSTEAEMAQLRRRLQAGCTSSAQLDAAAAALEQIRASFKPDPLFALGQLNTRIAPLLLEVQRSLEAADRLRADLQHAHAEMENVARTYREALSAADHTRSRILDCASLPQPCTPDSVAGLRDWLERLDEGCAGGKVAAVTVGLERWRAAARNLLTAQQRVAAECRAAIDLRNELRGRFEALKAKARARAVAEAPEVSAHAAHTAELLYARPTDTAACAAAVAAYEKLLQATPHPNGPQTL